MTITVVEVRVLFWAPSNPTYHVLTHCNLNILLVSIGVSLDHMVDHFSTYLFQKRGFYYFSRRGPRELHYCHAKHRIVLALNTRSRAKALKYAK